MCAGSELGKMYGRVKILAGEGMRWERTGIPTSLIHNKGLTLVQKLSRTYFFKLQGQGVLSLNLWHILLATSTIHAGKIVKISVYNNGNGR